MGLKSDQYGFLIGDGADVWPKAIEQWEEIARDIRLIRLLLDGKKKGNQTPVSPSSSFTPSAGSISPDIARIQAPVTPAKNDGSYQDRQALTQNTKKLNQVLDSQAKINRLTLDAAKPIEKSVYEKDISSTASAKISETRNSSQSTVSIRDNSGRFTKNNSSTYSTDRVITAITGLGSNILQGKDDIDPAIAATKEVIVPMMAIAKPLGNGFKLLSGRKKEAKKAAWYKKIYRHMRYSRRDENAWNKKQLQKLKDIEENGEKSKTGGLTKLFSGAGVVLLSILKAIMLGKLLMNGGRPVPSKDGKGKKGKSPRGGVASSINRSKPRPNNKPDKGFTETAPKSAIDSKPEKKPKGITSKVIGKAAGLITVALSASNIINSEMDADLTRAEKNVNIGENSGIATGAIAGGMAGASAGMVFPIFGIGPIIGGAVGAYMGSEAGAIIGKKAGEFFNPDRIDKLFNSISSSFNDATEVMSEAWESTKGVMKSADGWLKEKTGFSPSEEFSRSPVKRLYNHYMADKDKDKASYPFEYIPREEGYVPPPPLAPEEIRRRIDEMKRREDESRHYPQPAMTPEFTAMASTINDPWSKNNTPEAVAPKAPDALPDQVLDTRVKDSGGKTTTLRAMGVKTYSELESNGGQAFQGGHNDPSTLYATSLIQKGLGKNFNRVTAQNDLYHQRRDKNKSRKSAHTKGYKTDFTVKDMSYADAHKKTAKIMQSHGLEEGKDFKMISTPHGTGKHIDFSLLESGRAKMQAKMDQSSAESKPKLASNAKNPPIADNKIEPKAWAKESPNPVTKKPVGSYSQRKEQNWDNEKGNIVEASNIAGVDAGTVAAIANFESGFNPDAKPISTSKPHLNKVTQFDGTKAISSAHGYGQFINSTWKETLNKHGSKYGIEGAGSLSTKQANKHRKNKKLQAAMLAEFTKDNIDAGNKHGGSDELANVYAMHNLGSGDGTKFLKAMKANPNAPVSSVLSKSVIKNNPSLYQDGRMSVKNAYATMGKKMRPSAGTDFIGEARSIQAKSANKLAPKTKPIITAKTPDIAAPKKVNPIAAEKVISNPVAKPTAKSVEAPKKRPSFTTLASSVYEKVKPLSPVVTKKPAKKKRPSLFGWLFGSKKKDTAVAKVSNPSKIATPNPTSIKQPSPVRPVASAPSMPNMAGLKLSAATMPPNVSVQAQKVKSANSSANASVRIPPTEEKVGRDVAVRGVAHIISGGIAN